MAGVKTVEFRKVNIPRDISHVVLYATAPQKQILGYFTVKRVAVAHPSMLWQRFGKAGCVTEDEFAAYYGRADFGVAIVIEHVHRFCRPLETDLNGLLTPVPQSFKYLSSEDWTRLRKRSGT